MVPELTVATDKTSYRRAETVTISGTLQSNGSPISGEAVALAIQPPTGDAYSLPQATTDGDGNFSVNWDVPSDAVAGEYTVTATAMGISATTTFTLSIAFE